MDERKKEQAETLQQLKNFAFVVYDGKAPYNMDYKRLGNRIREERLRLNLTQAQLAEAVDISDTRIW